MLRWKAQGKAPAANRTLFARVSTAALATTSCPVNNVRYTLQLRLGCLTWFVSLNSSHFRAVTPACFFSAFIASSSSAVYLLTWLSISFMHSM